MTNNNFALLHTGDAARQELHDALGLTGCEVSVNTLPAGAGIPFVHAHTKNEEVYGVLAGSLEGFTATDGVLCEEKAPWMK